jgi:hypothetical protein
MGNPWKGEPLRLLMTGTPIPIWMGTQNSPPLMLYNFDPGQNIYAGYQPNIAINGPNTQLLPPNFGMTMDGTRTIYVIGPKNSGPLQVTPGGAHPFQLANVTIVTNPTNTPTEDASTPAVVRSNEVNAPSITTAAFSPPAGSWLVACINCVDISNAVNVTVTNTGTALTWTNPVSIKQDPNGNGTGNYSAIFIAFNASAQANITVTAHNSDQSLGTSLIQLGLRVVTGANANQTGAANGSNSGIAVNNTSDAIVPTKIGSLIYVVGNQRQNTTGETPLSGTTNINVDTTGSIFAVMIGKSTMNTTVLGSTTFGWSCTQAGNMTCVTLELVP